MSEAQKPVEAIGSQCANSPSGSSILKIDAVVRDRIYVSSRTQKPKNGVFANGVESIYEAIGSQCANRPSGSSILKIDAVVRDRIYVSSRTQKPKNGVFANGVESIY